MRGMLIYDPSPLYGGIDEVTNEEGRDSRVIAASLVT